jgi:hypothetical protein
VRTTSFWNNLLQVRSKPKYFKEKYSSKRYIFHSTGQSSAADQKSYLNNATLLQGWSHHNLVDRYEISISQMAIDLFPCT